MASLRNDMKPLGVAGLSTILIKEKRVLTLPNPDIPQNAVKGELPKTLKPHLATLVDGPPSDPAEWAYEFKLDGYRILARIDDEKIQLVARNGDDWSHKLPHLVKAIDEMNLRSGWLDGEVIVPNEHGISDFQALQSAFDSSLTQSILYYVFDIPFHDGYDFRISPWVERRKYLERLFESRVTETVRFSTTVDVPAHDIIAFACRMGLEDVIGKKKNSLYASRRSPTWIKLKCAKRQEFVIGGYTDPKGSRIGFGSLLLGFYNEKMKLQYAGNVDIGFGDKKLDEMKSKLEQIAGTDNPFIGTSQVARKGILWVKPQLVAEISFGAWTKGGHIRHPVFHGFKNRQEG